jgi:type II secretory pathway pseudopilin PulG
MPSITHELRLGRYVWNPWNPAFTVVELLVIIAITVLAAAVLLAGLARAKQRARREGCVNNLKQIGLGFKTWALDGGDYFVTGVSTNGGRAREFAMNGEVFRAFQVMSNELRAPKVLVCPADVRRPAPAFENGFGNSNLSYFASINAQDSDPEMFLSGDRNLTNGPLSPNRLLLLNTNYPAGWTRAIHVRQGNIVLSDGSVQQFSIPGLKPALSNCWWHSNTLAFP